VQDLRKELGCEFTDRIEIGVVTDSAELQHAIKLFLEYISAETLAITVVFAPMAGVEPIAIKIGEHEAKLYVRVVR
jgi:isoleucyl-tRNA synthetase